MKKPHNWAQALQAELNRQPDGFTEEHKSMEEIRKELRAAGLPSGRSYSAQYVHRLVSEGKATMVDGIITKNGRRVRCVKYLLLK